MAQEKAPCPCCNNDVEIKDGKLVGHSRGDMGYCEGSEKTPDELKDTGCPETKDQ